MRFSLIALALLSLPAFACPDLTGTYAACRSTTGTTTGSSDVVVTQRVLNGVTIYSVTSTDDETGERDTSEFPADGQTYTSTETEEGYEVTTTANISCQGNNVVFAISSSIGGAPVLEMNASYSRVDARTMAQDLSGSVMGQPYEDRVICQ